MNTIQIVTEAGHDQEQLVVGGQVPGMLSAAATFQFATVRVVEPIQAHRPRAASEPRPLVGEGGPKQKRLEREIGELEVAHGIVRDAYNAAPCHDHELFHDVLRAWKAIEVKRSELAAFVDGMPNASLTALQGYRKQPKLEAA